MMRKNILVDLIWRNGGGDDTEELSGQVDK